MQLIVGNLHEAEVAVAYFKGLEAPEVQAQEPVKAKAKKPPRESTESTESTIEDLRAAAVAHKEAHGKEATLVVLGGRKLAEIDKSEYSDLVKALA